MTLGRSWLALEDSFKKYPPVTLFMCCVDKALCSFDDTGVKLPWLESCLANTLSSFVSTVDCPARLRNS
jgi:hypothetical protein